ncbi:phenylalanine--tRNA ligase subunit beta [bacterium]|nr:phenylalanine--tRNA ligase subunit beta [bacterium]
MKISYTWLKELVPGLKVRPQAIANSLTLVGLEVEAIHDLAAPYQGIVVGEVLEKKPHPSSDKLSVCQVSDGKQVNTVVCGAPNVEAGKKYPFATLGTRFENGMVIEKRKIRDVESSGMLCSASELNLSSESSGLLTLADNAKTGMEFSKFYGLDDVVLEIGLTPNRGDCFSHVGVAREVAAIYGLKSVFPKEVSIKGTFSLKKELKVQNAVSKLCTRYSSRMLKNVSVSPSPQAVQNRLAALGIRPINNVVDATNYVMLLTGHPVHAFDARFVSGGTIKISTAQKLSASQFKTLDGVDRKLEGEDLLIADSEKAIALAGIMGGENSGIRSDTTTVILEVAQFHPTAVRKTSRRLGLVTDSSQRFERFVSPETIPQALNLLTSFIIAWAGGEASSDVIDLYPVRFKKLNLTLREDFLKGVTGVAYPARDIEKILKALEFAPKKAGKAFKVTVPSYRSDVTREIDLAEEIVRFKGMDAIPAVFPPALMRTVYESNAEKRERTLRDFFVSEGFFENIHYSFTDPVLTQKMGVDQSSLLNLMNPLSAELSVMRDSLWPQLLSTASKNWSAAEGVLRVFECRSIYQKPRIEKKSFAALYAGAYVNGGLNLPKVPVDFYFGKKMASDAFKKLGYEVSFQKGAVPGVYHPANSLVIKAGEITVGYVGTLHPQIAEKFEIGETNLLEIDLEALEGASKASFKFQKLNPYPQVKRDLALVVDRSISYDSIEKAIKSKLTPWLVNVEIFDIYQGDKIESSKKSLSLALTYESFDKTLTDDEVNRAHFELVDKLRDSHGYLLR